MIRSFSFSCPGASHLKKGIVCQDSSGHGDDVTFKYAVVSDGHGGADYFRSDRGSRFAVKAFGDCVTDAFTSVTVDAPIEGDEPDIAVRNFADVLLACTTPKQIDEKMRWFESSIIARWNAMVEEDFKNDPFKPEELSVVSEKARNRYENGEKIQSAYGATLIGLVVAEGMWFGIHIGDGKCIAFDKEGKCSEPIPWDDQCFLNVTTSICDKNALAECRHYFSREIPAAVFVASDGIDDCFANEKRLHNFYRVIMSSFVTEDEEEAFSQLKEYLPQLSAQGSGDDMSVAGLIDIEHIMSAPELYERIRTSYIKIMRNGNLGAPKTNESYSKTSEVEAVVGTLDLEVLGFGGFGKGVREIEVLTVNSAMIKLKIADKLYELVPDQPVEIIDKQLTPHGYEYDVLVVQMYLK